MGNYQDLLAIVDQGFQDVKDSLGILFTLRVASCRWLSVIVRFVNVTNIQLRKISSGKLRAVGVDALALESFEQLAVRSWGVVRAMAKHNGEVRSLQCHVERMLCNVKRYQLDDWQSMRKMKALATSAAKSNRA